MNNSINTDSSLFWIKIDETICEGCKTGGHPDHYELWDTDTFFTYADVSTVIDLPDRVFVSYSAKVAHDILFPLHTLKNITVQEAMKWAENNLPPVVFDR